MKDFSGDLAALARRLEEAESYLDLPGLRARIEALEPEMQRADLWDDADRARRVTTEHNRLAADLGMVEGLVGRLEDARTLFELAREEGDDSVEAEIADLIDGLSVDLDELEVRSLFTGEHDERDAVCEIHAGEGGTDAQDWANMMLRMYERWAERRGFDVELDEATEGQEAGILSATFIVRGRYAYGLLSGERGVHRLYRISPFDSQARRQTSYAAFDTVPFLEDLSDEVKIDEKDLRIDTYRSSGAGGQHVNVTDSAVRITHLPTGIVVSCQNERSQFQNKARAMQILAAKLAERQREERRRELEDISGPQGQVSRAGSFIRGYVLAPYQKVKDERSSYETGNVDAVLDGDLDAFMEAWLRFRRGMASPGAAG
ncbi:MAG TPA: peptide chain release factor 2 [Acidimicrobiales bacterium]|nr:peptide chain release factor 2 [Acidimicrobiales bacterium]